MCDLELQASDYKELKAMQFLLPEVKAPRNIAWIHISNYSAVQCCDTTQSIQMASIMLLQ